MELWNQLINSITCGNQKWVGAIPAFTPRAIEIKLLEGSIEFRGRNLIIEIPANTIIKDARAWVKKYLIEASEELGEGLNTSKGIKAIKFISNPNHAINHDEEEIDTLVLNIKTKIKQMW